LSLRVLFCISLFFVSHFLFFPFFSLLSALLPAKSPFFENYTEGIYLGMHPKSLLLQVVCDHFFNFITISPEPPEPWFLSQQTEREKSERKRERDGDRQRTQRGRERLQTREREREGKRRRDRQGGREESER